MKLKTLPSPCAATHACDEGVFASWVAALVVRHRGRLMAFVRRQGLEGEEALDGVQEAFQTFLRLPEARDLAGDPEASARMLTTLARNVARTRRRRVRTEARRVVGEAPVDAVMDDGPGAEALLARAEEETTLRQCVHELGEVQRAVVTMRMLEDLPGEQVATILGLSAQHVAVLLYRAKTSLRGCMAAAGHGAPHEGEPRG